MAMRCGVGTIVAVVCAGMGLAGTGVGIFYSLPSYGDTCFDFEEVGPSEAAPVVFVAPSTGTCTLNSRVWSSPEGAATFCWSAKGETNRKTSCKCVGTADDYQGNTKSCFMPSLGSLRLYATENATLSGCVEAECNWFFLALVIQIVFAFMFASSVVYIHEKQCPRRSGYRPAEQELSAVVN